MLYTAVDFVAADRAQELSKTLDTCYEDLLDAVCKAGNADAEVWAARMELASARANILRTQSPKAQVEKVPLSRDTPRGTHG